MALCLDESIEFADIGAAKAIIVVHQDVEAIGRARECESCRGSGSKRSTHAERVWGMRVDALQGRRDGEKDSKRKSETTMNIG